jgi:6-pyruvoyltetrahydropterin/6-carboxytetrahydropterin synthase
MIRLSRETRFALVPPQGLDDGQSKNSWAGWPASDLVAPQLRLQLVVCGKPDPQTGYLCNIKLIDQMFRQIIVEDLIPAAACEAMPSGQQVLDKTWRRLHELWPSIAPSPTPTIERLSLHLSPFLKLSATQKSLNATKEHTMEPHVTSAPQVTSVTQQFEFSAAHRLHCEELSAEKNIELFGKCNNPNGHGHNYVVEVTLNQSSSENQPINLREMESIVKRLVIDPLDHKHLNDDVEYFGSVNPTVENIAFAIFNWLQGQFDGSNLSSVKVFETPKTWAECRSRHPRVPLDSALRK